MFLKSHSDRFRHIHAFPAYSEISRHNQAYSGIIQAYSGPCLTLSYSEIWHIHNPGTFKTRGIFRTLVYPKPWYIQNQIHLKSLWLLRTLRYSEPERYLEPIQTSAMERYEKQLTVVIVLASYNSLYSKPQKNRILTCVL